MKCRVCGSFNFEITESKFRCKKCGHTEKNESKVFSDLFDEEDDIYPCRMCNCIIIRDGKCTKCGCIQPSKEYRNAIKKKRRKSS